MEIIECCHILGVQQNAADDAITAAYRRLALKFHPDRNRDNQEAAHKAMTRLNLAYSTLMSWRFQNSAGESEEQPAPQKKQTPQFWDDDALLKIFIRQREDAKAELYKFFQYKLYILARRDTSANKYIFSRIVKVLKRTYHEIQNLETRTKDAELLEHFSVFRKMIFDFYRSSECIDINDNYRDMYEVEAYRLYKKGDDALNAAAKEIFYDRHNRGFLKGGIAATSVIDAEIFLQNTMLRYPNSTWTVETKIKQEFAASLKAYMSLFFSE